MQKKNILKTRFIELTGSFFNTDNTCQTQQDYAFQYALKHELDYLLINDRQEVNHHNLTTIPVNKIDSINDKIELFNYDKQVYYSTNPIKTKSQNNYPLYRIYDKPNFKKIHLFNKEISIPQYKRFLKYHRINILINEDLYYLTNPKEQIINSILQGNSYLVNYLHGTPYNFYAVISDNDLKSATLGETIKLEDKELCLYFNLSEVSDVHLCHNNKHLQSKHDKQGMFKITNIGSYQLIINRYSLNWIYTNPIYVT